MFVENENIGAAIVRRLRGDGHDVLWIAESAPGIDDASVLALAERDGRLLVTADTDFGDHAIRQRRASAGVVLLRLAGLATDRKAALVASAIAQHLDEMRGAFTVVAPAHVRIRRP